jgi:16S rRNA G966 N2-methylase RsmD
LKKGIISEATSRNWKRLRSKKSGRLMARANKQLSTKTIMPLEYFSNKDNVAEIQRFVSFCKEQNYKVEEVLFSVALRTLRTHEISEKPHVQRVLNEYLIQPIQSILNYPPPTDENDILGLLYQCFLLEGEKNRKGSYYTPYSVAKNMVQGLDFSKNQTFFDPCCGSGAFILALEGASPNQIFACDNDPIAVMIAKINMLLRFKDEVFEPQIVYCDYLKCYYNTNLTHESFDYIVSNPPWGAIIFDKNGNQVTTRESFSYFFEKAFNQLSDGGMIRFLLPESVLNVKTHKNFRKFLLENTDIQSITLYDGAFSGVQTKYIDIESRRTRHALSQQDEIRITSWDKACLIRNEKNIKKACFHLTNNLNFNLLSDSDLEKVQKILSKGKYTLKDSIWGLGIVTGDNKKHLKAKQGKGFEPIYTGKEIEAYTLKAPKYYIKYKRTDYQQVAKDEIYRADEKLVYKFISKNIVFAYDDNKSLVLNSANILIPRIPGMSVKTVLAFLNSSTFKFLYKSLFGEIKILKGNLMELPFPKISEETDKKLTNLVDEVLKGNKKAMEVIDNEVAAMFEIPRATRSE